MKKFGPFDLVGLQECDDANLIANGLGWGASHEWKQGPEDLGMGYDKSKFERLGEFQAAKYAKDQYGDRQIAWVRLRQKKDGATIFFGNVHGPLPGPEGSMDGKHGHEVAGNLIKIVEDNIQPGDALIITGDYNALPQNDEIKDFNAKWGVGANDHTTRFDRIYILNETTNKVSEGDFLGSPSDHSILYGEFQTKRASATSEVEVVV